MGREKVLAHDKAVLIVKEIKTAKKIAKRKIFYSTAFKYLRFRLFLNARRTNRI